MYHEWGPLNTRGEHQASHRLEASSYQTTENILLIGQPTGEGSHCNLVFLQWLSVQPSQG